MTASTVTCSSMGGSRETVKIRGSPSSTVAVVALIERRDASSSMMVPVAVPLPSGMVAFDGPVSLITTVSSLSDSSSPVTATVMVFDGSLAAKVSVPDTFVKSVPGVAVPPLLA